MAEACAVLTTASGVMALGGMRVFVAELMVCRRQLRAVAVGLN